MMLRLTSAALGAIALVAAFGLAAPQIAEAQGRPSPLTLRLGGAFPVGDTDDSLALALGGELDLPRQGRGIGPKYSVSLDWFQVTTDYGAFQNDISLLPLLFNAKWNTPSVAGKSIEYGGGLGLLFAEEDAILETEDVGLGWQLFAGYHFTPRVRGDLRFVSGDSPGDNGFFLAQLGFRL